VAVSIACLPLDAVGLNSAREGVFLSAAPGSTVLNLPYSSSLTRTLGTSVRAKDEQRIPAGSSYIFSSRSSLHRQKQDMSPAQTDLDPPVLDCPRSNRHHPISPHASIGNLRFAPCSFSVDCCTAEFVLLEKSVHMFVSASVTVNDRTIAPVSF
jgi:hypothetical protein